MSEIPPIPQIWLAYAICIYQITVSSSHSSKLQAKPRLEAALARALVLDLFIFGSHICIVYIYNHQKKIENDRKVIRHHPSPSRILLFYLFWGLLYMFDHV